MIISISGLPGAGKSTVAKALAKKLNWPTYSIGDLRRQIARDKGMTLTEYNKLGEIDSSTDLEVDEYQEELGKTKDNFIIEGRTSWHFIPQSFKIFLTVDPKIGAERILFDLKESDKRNEGSNLKTVQDVINSNVERIACDTRRYKKYFQIDAYNQSNYDYILDTSNMNAKEMLTAVYNKVVEKSKM
jgi:cytidylate kinase